MRILTSLRSPAVLLKDKDLMETLIPQSISTIDAGDANFADEYRRIEADGLTGENTDFLSIGKKEAVYKRSIMKLMRHVDETPSSAPPPGQPSCVYYYEQLWAFMNVNDTIQPIRSILGVSEREFINANTLEDIRKILNWTKDSNFLLYNNSQFVDNQQRLSIFKILSTQNGNVSQFLITNAGGDYRRMLNWSILIAFCCMLENNTLKMERIRELVKNIHYAFLGWVEREKKTTGGDIFLKKSNTAKDTYRERVLTILLGDIKTDRTLEPLITAIQTTLLSLDASQPTSSKTSVVPKLKFDAPKQPISESDRGSENESDSDVSYYPSSASSASLVGSDSKPPPPTIERQPITPRPFGMKNIREYQPVPHPPGTNAPPAAAAAAFTSPSHKVTIPDPDKQPPRGQKEAWTTPRELSLQSFRPRLPPLSSSASSSSAPPPSSVRTPPPVIDWSGVSDRPPPSEFDPTESKRLYDGTVYSKNQWKKNHPNSELPGPSRQATSTKPVPPLQPKSVTHTPRRPQTARRITGEGGNKRTRKHPRIARRRAAHHKTIRRAAAAAASARTNHKYTRRSKKEQPAPVSGSV